MIKQDLFSTAADMATELKSRYRNTSKCREDLLDFMNNNGWFGIQFKLSNESVVIAAEDYEKFRSALILWLSAYKKSGREKLDLMLRFFLYKYPITCSLYQRFANNPEQSQNEALWKLLDYLLSEIDKEIVEYSENELDDLIKKMYTETTLVVLRTFVDFLQTTEYRERTLTSWKYYFDEHQKSELLTSAYSMGDFSRMAYYVFNDEAWQELGLIKKATESKTYADLWLFTALHFVCALRKSDIKRLPVPKLPFSNNIIRERILNNRFCSNDACRLTEEMNIRFMLKPMKPSKTATHNNIPDLKLFIPESLKEPFGIILAIALTHRTNKNSDETLFGPQSRLIWRPSQIKAFFGIGFVNALGNRNFSCIRANKSYLQGIEAVVDMEEKGAKAKGYIIAALARSHKGGIGTLAQTTDVYLKDARFGGYKPEFIIREMFERGVFSFIPAVLLEMLMGKEYKRLPVHEQTVLIKEVGMTPYQIEKMMLHASLALIKSRKTVASLISDISCVKENANKILQNIASGNAPGRCDEYLCLMTAAEQRCCFPERDTCIGCGYEIYTKAALQTLMKEYVYLTDLKKTMNNAAESKRYSLVLEKAIFPAVAEMIGAAKMLYDKTYMPELLNIVERGIEYADSKM